MLILDALGHDIHVEIAAHLDDRVDQRRVVGVGYRVADEGFVNFQRADRELLKGTQR